MRSTTRLPPARLSQSELARYWSDLSRRHLDRADDGLSVICYAGMPAWFNRFLDVYQRKALGRLLQGADFSGKRVLDVGTGVGRWARWFARWPGTQVVGIDIEPLRLSAAREHGGSITYLRMPVDKLAFPDASFDVVSCVTVLQHVDADVKRDAVAEFSRVLKPGGLAVVFELTDTKDDARHVFPWSHDTWVAEFDRNDLCLVKAVGDQYTPLLRLLKAAYGLWRGPKARDSIDQTKRGSNSSFLLALLRPAVAVSYPMEEAARFLPSRLARMTGFALRKAETENRPPRRAGVWTA